MGNGRKLIFNLEITLVLFWRRVKTKKKWAKTKTNHLLVIFLDCDIPMIYVSFGSPPPCGGEWEKSFGIVMKSFWLLQIKTQLEDPDKEYVYYAKKKQHRTSIYIVTICASLYPICMCIYTYIYTYHTNNSYMPINFPTNPSFRSRAQDSYLNL